MTVYMKATEAAMSTGKICLVCKHENPPDAAKCIHCGAPLRVAETLLFRSQSQSDVIETYKVQDITVEPGAIALQFVGKGQPLFVRVEDEVTLGRVVPGEPAPTIDLTDYRAGLLGVSRHHAVIYASQAGYVIEDLNSANGTWVNENRLTPHVPYDLHDRDQVRLGELIFFVFFTAARS
jgi:pSer/pThr/pTyr-binding forkhead associated (FHA) protein